MAEDKQKKKKEQESQSKQRKEMPDYSSDPRYGSVDPNRDTVYRVGADDPSGYYTQSQLNNNMSGTDANAIYYATHNQSSPWTYSSPGERLGIYGETPQEYNDRLREEGYKVNTGRQTASPIEGYNAYTAGADAWFEPGFDALLQPGQGSTEGIPAWLLNEEGKRQKYREALAAMLGGGYGAIPR